MTQQLSMFNETNNTPRSVSDLTRYIKELFDSNMTLQDVWVEGEISNFTRAASGHLYFSLKDRNAQLKCVMWKTAAARLNFNPQHGDLVVAQGSISVYEAQGAYQLYAQTLQPAGVGDLNRQFELLKARLDAEGLFDPDRKRTLPAYPRTIGIVTSPTAAGFQDVLNILARRFPSAQVILSPAQVQGKTAPPTIIRAIQRLNQRGDVDLMMIVRGGGSLEDLWCFNDEGVVRAVANSQIPTITGVGHEIDFTLVDFAADYRAPTPSAAAEIAVPDSQDLLRALNAASQQMTSRLSKRIRAQRDELDGVRRTLRLLTPANQIAQLRQQIDDHASRAENLLKQRVQNQRQQLALLESRLNAASPQAILQRGYALVTRAADGTRITHASQAAPGTSILVQMQDGTLTSRVETRQLDEEDPS